MARKKKQNKNCINNILNPSENLNKVPDNIKNDHELPLMIRQGYSINLVRLLMSIF